METADGGVKSARRTIDLLETFAADHSWTSLAELHARTGVPRSSLHGLLRTLHDTGWIEADASGARFRLGVRALICGTAYLDRDPVKPYATDALERVRERTGFTAHYARRHGTEVVYLETRESRHSHHLVSRVGRTLPAHATALGKALLAELTVTRERGFALERAEGTPGVACVATVIPYRIPGSDALSCSVPAERVSDAEARALGTLLHEVAAELGQRLRRAGIR